MILRWYGRPDRVAKAMIDSLEAGEIRTQGAWVHFIRHLERLPPRLRIWTMEKIREIAGDNTHDYILSWINSPRPVPAGVH
jgi:hypothetical protein